MQLQRDRGKAEKKQKAHHEKSYVFACLLVSRLRLCKRLWRGCKWDVGIWFCLYQGAVNNILLVLFLFPLNEYILDIHILDRLLHIRYWCFRSRFCIFLLSVKTSQ